MQTRAGQSGFAVILAVVAIFHWRQRAVYFAGCTTNLSGIAVLGFQLINMDRFTSFTFESAARIRKILH